MFANEHFSSYRERSYPVLKTNSRFTFSKRKPDYCINPTEFRLLKCMDCMHCIYLSLAEVEPYLPIIYQASTHKQCG